MKKLLLAASLTLLVSNLGHTQGFNDDFSTTQGWTGNNTAVTDLVQPNPWTTNDTLQGSGNATVGETNFVKYVSGLTPGSSRVNNSVLFGGVYAADGYYPGNTNPTITRTFVAVTTNGTNPFVRVSTDFAIVNPNDLAYPAKDTFGFDLRNGSGSIAKFSFSPGPVTPPIQSGYDLRFQWTQNGTVQTTSNPALNGYTDTAYSQRYRLQVDLSASAFNASILTLDTSNNVIASAQVVINGAVSGGLDGRTVTEFVATWDLANISQTTPNDATALGYPLGYVNAGSNYLGINAASASAIPEPGTVVLAAIGLGTLLLARRRFTKA